jgi:hypothetical protein
LVTFFDVVDSSKAMFLTSHICFELKTFDYGAITIEFVNCLLVKINGDILFECLPIFHPLKHYRQLQGMDKKFNGHAWCKL